MDQLNLPNTGWTNLLFLVTASTSSTLLQFGFQNDPDFFSLDDVSVLPATPSFVPGSLRHFSNGQFQFTLSGATSLEYEIQVSTNLQNWSVLGTISMTNTTSDFLDTGASSTRRFYRARLVPE